MKKVVMYMRPTCPYCRRAMALLGDKGADIETIDISAHPERREEMIAKSNGGETVPQIFIGSTHVGGCDDLFDLDDDGKLDSLLTD